MKGILKVVTDKDNYRVDIIALINQDTAGEYIPQTHNNQEELEMVTYDVGVAESYDISKDEIIKFIEIEELIVDNKEEYSVNVELVKHYYDYNNNVTVIEFR